MVDNEERLADFCEFQRFSFFSFGARMEFFVSFSQMRIRNMRVNLRRGNIAVSEHLLNASDIGVVLYQMRGKTVPQRVRRNVFKPGFFGVFFYKLKNHLARY